MGTSVKKFFVRFFHRALIGLLSGEENQYRDYWQWRFIDWTKIGSPWRMSASEEQRYEAIIRSKRVDHPKILILGATPALRMIAARAGGEVACADFSLPMLREMGKFVDKVIPGATSKEIWFVGDWLKIPFPEHHFDFVLGDMVFPFVRRSHRGRFLEKIKKTLSAEGTFVTRTHVADETLRKKTLEECLDAFFRAGGRTSQLLNVVLLDWSFDPATGLTNRKKIVSDAKNHLAHPADGKTKKLLAEFLNRYTSGIDFNFEGRAPLENDLQALFAIQEVFTPDDYPVQALEQYFPLYILRSRNEIS